MKKNILIVDAYNMIGNWPQLDKLKKSDRLEDARDLLLKILSNYRKQANTEIIVVFDAMYVPGMTNNMSNMTYKWYGQLKIKQQILILNHWLEDYKRH